MDCENESDNMLFCKDGLQFIKAGKNTYKLTCSMENKNIILSQIIDFNLIKLIYDLNSDIYEKVNIEKINDNEVIATLLMKNLFEDIGMSQKYANIRIQKRCEEGKIIFNSKSIKNLQPKIVPDDSELMEIEEMVIVCDAISNHQIHFTFYISFDLELNIPNFVEKIVGVIIGKIFKRVKQFIENVRL